METPVFSKREPRPYDYQEMTWVKFIQLREWAKKTSKEISYPIYLVGSTLYKEVPRDFDIVIVIPLDDYEKMFGKLTEENVYQKIADAFNKYVKYYGDCVNLFGGLAEAPIDFKVYPDCWFEGEDRLLLGKPIKE